MFGLVRDGGHFINFSNPGSHVRILARWHADACFARFSSSIISVALGLDVADSVIDGLGEVLDVLGRHAGHRDTARAQQVDVVLLDHQVALQARVQAQVQAKRKTGTSHK